MVSRGEHSFPRARRLRKRSDYVAVQTQGARVAAGCFVILLRARRDTEPARLGITVTRKVGNAVARNRLKRLVRESFRQTPELWPAGTDVVVIPRLKGAPGSVTDLRLEDVLMQWRAAQPLIERRALALHRDLAGSANPPHTSRRPGPSAGRKGRT